MPIKALYYLSAPRLESLWRRLRDLLRRRKVPHRAKGYA